MCLESKHETFAHRATGPVCEPHGAFGPRIFAISRDPRPGLKLHNGMFHCRQVFEGGGVCRVHFCFAACRFQGDDGLCCPARFPCALFRWVLFGHFACRLLGLSCYVTRSDPDSPSAHVWSIYVFIFLILVFVICYWHLS